MTPNNNITHLPRMFFDSLDYESRVACMTVSTEFNQYISNNLLNDLKISPITGTASYSLLMLYYRRHCEYFRRILPTIFEGMNWTTVLSAKQMIDSRLLTPEHWDIPLVTSVWNHFITTLDPIEKPLIRQLAIASSHLENRNEEVRLMLNAGAEPDLYGIFNNYSCDQLAKIVQQDWCTLETAQLLLDKNIKVTAKAAAIAIKTERFYSLLPRFLSMMPTDDKSLSLLMQAAPASHQSFVEKQMLKVAKVKLHIFRDALDKNYSDQAIATLLNKCPEGAIPYHIRLALDSKRPEELIVAMLNKCEKKVDDYHIYLALEHQYSAQLIEQLLAKHMPDNDGRRALYNIRRALELKYPAHLIALLEEKLNPDQLTEYHQTVEYVEAYSLEWRGSMVQFKPSIRNYCTII